jgi:hypothetical protein
LAVSHPGTSERQSGKQFKGQERERERERERGKEAWTQHNLFLAWIMKGEKDSTIDLWGHRFETLSTDNKEGTLENELAKEKQLAIQKEKGSRRGRRR